MQYVGRIVVELNPGNAIKSLGGRRREGKHIAKDVGVPDELALVDFERDVFHEEDDIAIGEPEVCGLEIL